MITWNVCGLRAREDELRALVATRAPDVIVLQETMLKPRVAAPHIMGYSSIRKDRILEAGGGLLTYYRSTMEVKKEVLDLGSIETLTLATHAGRVVNAYARPGPCRLRDFAKFALVTETTTLCGDFNALHKAWGDARTSPYGSLLLKQALKYHLNVHRPAEPTRLALRRNQRDSILDIAVCTEDVKVNAITVLKNEGTTSDHLPVVFELGECTAGPIFFKKTTNWVDAAAALDRPFQETDDLEYDLQHFTSACQVAMMQHSSCIPLKNRNYFLLPPPIRKLQLEKKQMVRRLRTRTADPALRKQVNKVGRQIRKLLREKENEKITEELQEIDDPKTRWQRINKGKPRPPAIPTLVCDNGEKAVSEVEKAEVLAAALEVKFRDADTRQKKSERRGFRNLVKAIKEAPVESTPQITLEQLNKALQELKPKSAPGPDGVPNCLLRILPDPAKAFLLSIFNRVLASQRYPALWKTAHVTMLLKKGKSPTSPGSYRPISLLSCIGKLFERCLLNFINTAAIPDHQFGFRAEHGCVQQLVRVVTDVTANMNLDRPTIVVSLDIEAAFDRVPHKELIVKMFSTGQALWMCKLLHSYYQDRTFCVKVGGQLSLEHPIGAGTAQGANISPTLYSLYVSDMPVVEHVKVYQYADDTLAVATGGDTHEAAAHLAKYLTKLEAWCRTWKTTVNASKSEAIVIRKRHTQGAQLPELRFKGAVIPYVPVIRYLGVFLDKHLNFQHHAQQRKQWGLEKTAALFKWIKCRTGISPATKLVLYKTLILSKIQYGLPAWQGIRKTYWEPLLTLERSWIRMITFLPYETDPKLLYEACPEINLQNHAVKVREQFRTKAADHPNILVRKLLWPTPIGRLRYPLDPIVLGTSLNEPPQMPLPPVAD